MNTHTFHLALIGDSIFDNAAYVPEGAAVIDHLRHQLPAAWLATLVASDGDVVTDIDGQLSRVPAEATHLFVSIGGNDALNALNVLSRPAHSVNEAMSHLTDIRQEFHRGYHAMLAQVLRMRRPVTVCTIYDAIPGLSAELQTALCIFNDTIVREALAARVPVIDLRNICTEAEDYSSISPIEPSGQGGHKIAEVIAKWITSGN